jgi:hypothetical protein
LAHKFIRRDIDPTAQKVYEENAERMLLASFVGDLAGEIGKLTRIQNPQNLDQALNAALAVREAVRQEKNTETFYTRFERPDKFSSRGGKGKVDNRHHTKKAPRHPNNKG